MRYLSVFSGIDAATVAWAPLGWQAVAFAEIEKFPSAVLAYHYPDVPNLGDVTKIDGEKYRGAVDLLVGGSPCQSFSVAGLRKGLNDERGNLTLEFVRIANESDPAFIVWENVPGVLSDEGNAFGCFLGALAGEDAALEPPGGRWSDAGYVLGPRRAIAWRILDAQYFGLAQRRKRVFLVGCPGDGADPRKILFEFGGGRRDTPPRRKAQADVAGTLEGSAGGRGANSAGVDVSGFLQVTQALTGRLGGGGPDDNKAQGGFYVEAAYGGNFSGEIDAATTLKSGNQRLDMESETFIAHSLRADGFDASEDGTGRQNLVACSPLSPTVCAGPPFERTGNDRVEAEALVVAFHGSQDPDVSGDVTHPCGRNNGLETCIAFTERGRKEGRTQSRQILTRSAVRRLLPVECERLQGFPDDYTALKNYDTWRDVDANESPEDLRSEGYRVRQTKKGKWRVNDPDGPRYRAIGNSMAVPVMRWIGERIQAVEALYER
ncbi:MAG: DNA cytosine methyltransferase [Desulfovibrio sp.]|jgi:DNA (cytosine-5)-methyltransferase 1|nr:DNA cytosine methyltransferase [Desulfovibrio sp.]